VDGYFNQASVDAHASELNERAISEEAESEMRNAWDRFDYSFNSTEDEVVADLSAVFLKNVKHYHIGKLNSIVSIFKAIERPEAAKPLVDAYIEAKKEVLGAYNVESMYRGGAEMDPELRAQFNALHEARKPKFQTLEILKKLGTEGYASELQQKIADVTVDEYVAILKGHEGADLATISRALTLNVNLVNPSPVDETIMDRVGAALRIIAEESPMNKFRARRWGLIQRLDKQDAGTAQATAQAAAPAPLEEGGTTDGDGTEVPQD